MSLLRELNSLNESEEVSYIESPEFIELLNQWLFAGTVKHSKALASVKNKIPAKYRMVPSKVLYRGMRVDKTFIKKMTSTGVKFPESRSWTTSVAIAKEFAMEPNAGVNAEDLDPVVLTYVPTQKDVILNIDLLIKDYGIPKLVKLGLKKLPLTSAKREHEVLLDRGVVVKVNAPK